MPALTLPDVDEAVLVRLRSRAKSTGRSVEFEANAILSEALPATGQDAWARIDAAFEKLQATGRDFGDSLAELREARER